ncbi:MAG: CRTAC1 family protein [Rhodothermales bacterium]
MADAALHTDLPPRAKVFGIAFLLFQLLFAANNFGPQRIPVLNWVFDGPILAPEIPSSSVGDGTFRLEDVTARTGLDAFRRAPFHPSSPNYVEVMGGGLAVGDVDGDGRDDVFVTGMISFSDEPSTPSTLFRNVDGARFEDITAVAGLDELRGYPQGALFFDYDNDGDQDLFVAAYDGGQLFRNDGAAFTDVTDPAGVGLDGRCGPFPCFATTAAAADYDRDGHLDLIVVNNVDFDLTDPSLRGERYLFPAFFDPQPVFLFRNLGDGTFEDATAASGLEARGGKGLSAVWLDVNNDLWPDLYIANDLTRNTLQLNQGDGTFVEFGAGAVLDEIKSSMGLAAADYDHDGYVDIAVTNLEGSSISFFRNLGDLRFRYQTGPAGLGESVHVSGWGIQFVDLDLDGHPDLAVSGGPIWKGDDEEARNLIFRNLGEGRFADVTASTGAPTPDAASRGLAVLDADGSGRPDLLFSNADGGSPVLLANRPVVENDLLYVRLEGTASNRDGVGARVALERDDGHRQVQEVRAGGSYQRSSTKGLFFGLKDAAPTRLIVHWPSGAVDSLHALPSNTRILVREGHDSAFPL